MPNPRTAAERPTPRAARTPNVTPTQLARRILANAAHFNDEDRAAAQVRAWLLRGETSPGRRRG